MVMKSIVVSLMLLFIGTSLSGQFGVSARYQLNSGVIDETNTGTLEADKIPVNALEVGLSYWFRLKQKRVEFLPEVSYALPTEASIKTAGVGANWSDKFESSAFNVNMNVLVYPFDFHSDCSSCPTFSKEGNTIKKGFYWIFSPGITIQNFKGTLTNDGGIDTTGTIRKVSDSALALRLGVGGGIDIGLSNLLTFSPFVMYNYVSPSDYSSTLRAGEKSSATQIHLGGRIVLRLDKDKW